MSNVRRSGGELEEAGDELRLPRRVLTRRVERWMGPALRLEQVSVVGHVPLETQLALLAMTKQTFPSDGRTSSNDEIISIFSILGF